MKLVTIVTIGNGLWLGTLLWLVLGLWLEQFSFWQCLIAALVISWILAIWRGAKAIVARENDPQARLAQMEAEWKSGPSREE